MNINENSLEYTFIKQKSLLESDLLNAVNEMINQFNQVKPFSFMIDNIKKVDAKFKQKRTSKTDSSYTVVKLNEKIELWIYDNTYCNYQAYLKAGEKDLAIVEIYLMLDGENKEKFYECYTKIGYKAYALSQYMHKIEKLKTEIKEFEESINQYDEDEED